MHPNHQVIEKVGAQGRVRTTDTRIFRGRCGSRFQSLSHSSLVKFPRVFAAPLLAAALAFDPHVLLLSWSAERQETVAATSRATCEAARDAIAAGRWLADDPPAAMRCERGSAFAPGEGCIDGYNCGVRR
jgi:hypothetical protein